MQYGLSEHFDQLAEKDPLALEAEDVIASVWDGINGMRGQGEVFKLGADTLSESVINRIRSIAWDCNLVCYELYGDICFDERNCDSDD